MGLIKAAIGAMSGTLADQWKEYFTCNSLDNDTLMVKGFKNTSSRSSNTDGSDNVISDGSGIVVADGQCAIVVDQGIVTEVAAEPGRYTYDKGAQPTVFYGPLNVQKVKDVLGTMWERFKMGGLAGTDQRVYYFNIKEIVDNKFGTVNPIPFRIVDRNINIDMDLSVRCNGMFTFKITDPVSFYRELGGNVADVYEKETILPTLKQEFVGGLNEAFGALSNLNIRPYAIPQHVDELCESMNKVLNEKWSKRGITVFSIALNSVSLPEEEQELLKTLQRATAFANPALAAAQTAAAQADALKTAAGNANGAMNGFMGMGLAQGMGGNMNAASLFGMAQQQQQPTQANGWTCACGTVNTGKFCTECGNKKPEAPAGWTCACGTVNTGKFCTECGKPKPQTSSATCPNCGFTIEGIASKFCPQCGNKL